MHVLVIIQSTHAWDNELINEINIHIYTEMCLLRHCDCDGNYNVVLFIIAYHIIHLAVMIVKWLYFAY